MDLDFSAKQLKIFLYILFSISLLLFISSLLSHSYIRGIISSAGFIGSIFLVNQLDRKISVDAKTSLVGYIFQYGIGLSVAGVFVSIIKAVIHGVSILDKVGADALSILVTGVIVAISYFIVRTDKAEEWRNNIGTIVGGDFQKVEPGSFVVGDRIDQDKLRSDKIVDMVTLGKHVLPLKDRYTHMLVLGPTGSGKTSQILLPMTHQDVLAGNFKDSSGIPVVQLGQLLLEPKGDYAQSFWAMGKVEERNLRKNYLSFLVESETNFREGISRYKKKLKELLKIKNGSPLTKDEETKYVHLQNQRKNRNKLNPVTIIKVDDQFEELDQKKNGKPLTSDQQHEYKTTVQSIKNLATLATIVPKFANYEYLKSWTTYSLFCLAASLERCITSPYTSIKTYKNDIVPLFKDHSWNRDTVIYFNPVSSNSPYFNPLRGDEDTVVDLTQQVFAGDSGDAKGNDAYFIAMKKKVVEATVKVAKRLYGNDATLSTVATLMSDANAGEQMITQLQFQMDPDDPRNADTSEVIRFLRDDYYKGLAGGRAKSSVADNTADLRASVQLLMQNKYLKRILNPKKGEKNIIDFDRILADGDKIAMTTANGDVGSGNGTLLGKFLMLHIQSAVMHRPKGYRNPAIFYIDEFQQYANSSFKELLNQGRSFKVGAVLATQTLDLVKEEAGEGLVENIKTNSRSVCIFPGISIADSDYFKNDFGQREFINKEKTVTTSKDMSDGTLKSAFSKSKKQESYNPERKQEDYFSTSDFQYGIANLNKALTSVQKKTSDNKTFGYVFSRLIRGGNVTFPEVVKVNFLDRKYSALLDNVAEQYRLHTTISLADLEKMERDAKIEAEKEEQAEEDEDEEDSDEDEDENYSSFNDESNTSTNNDFKAQLEKLRAEEKKRASKKSDGTTDGGKPKNGEIDFGDFE